MTTRLLPGDPDRLGGYWLAGRLGSCFDAYDRGGRRYAIKMARGRAPVVAPHCVARVVESGPGFVVSEFVQGPSLREAVSHAGPYAGDRLHRIAVALATALVAIHDAGAVHRHLGPDCLLLGPEGPRVTGVGTADAQRPAPEVFTGGAAGPPADVFSWGATVLFAATGRDPFEAESLGELMHAVLTVDPDVSDLPEPLRSMAARALAKEPGERPTARELLIGLTGSAEPAVGAHLAGDVRPPEGLTGPPPLGDVAEGVYQGLPPEQQSSLPEVLLRMREPGRLPLAEVEDDPAVAALTEAGLLVRRSIAVPPVDRPEGRLVAVADDSVGPASPALFHAWPRLRSWAEDVTPFRRHRLRRRVLVAGLAAAVAVVLAATVVTVANGLSRQRRVGTADLAVAAHQAAREVAARAESMRSADPMTAMKLSVAAWSLAPVPEARNALQRSLGQSDLGAFTDPQPAAGTAYRLADDGASLLGQRKDEVRRWDLGTGKLVDEHPLPSPSHAWTSLSSDGRIYAAGDSASVRVWDLATGAAVKGAWPGGKPALHAQGRLLSVTTGFRTRLYSTGGGPPLLDVSRRTIVTSEDGRWATVAAASGEVQVWDLTRRERLYTRASRPYVSDAQVEFPPVTAFSRDGHRLVIGDTVLDTMTGDSKTRLNEDEEGAGGWGPLSFSPDGRFLLEPLEPDELEAEPPPEWTGPVSDLPTQGPAAFAQAEPEPELGQVVRLWRLSDGRLLGTYPARKATGQFAFSADGGSIRYTADGGTVLSIDVSDALTEAPGQQAVALSLTRQSFDGAAPRRLLSADGRVAAVQEGQRTSLYDTTAGRPMGEIPVAGELSFDGEGTLLAVGGEHTTIWDVATRTQVSAIPTGEVRDVALSADGLRLAAVGQDGLKVWSVPEGELVKGPLDTIRQPLAFSPNGGRLLAGHDLVDLSSGKVVETGAGDGFANAFSPDGTMAAFVTDADYFAVWKLATWPPQPVRRSAYGASIRFSPDGKLLAMGGDHTTLWDATTLREISRVPLGQDVADVAFSADGTKLIGLREDGSVRESPVDPAMAAKAVCAKAGGALDEAGWKRLFPLTPYPGGMCS
ncbi:protein kinase domain-containing protein [Nonomuraea sp. bgisy101]|uniref:protein kinase domain-containing protein n=1 Tax=Nonomuraea sp. bgisy101 TaxID=3413784 RepID=UPI003D762B59